MKILNLIARLTCSCDFAHPRHYPVEGKPGVTRRVIECPLCGKRSPGVEFGGFWQRKDVA